MSQSGKGTLRNCGNPLLCEWLEEWMEKAQSMQSKAYFTYRKAYASMASCPTPFQHPSQAEQLNGIGKGMAMKLEKRMIQHCKDNGLPIPTRVKKSQKRILDITDMTGDEEASTSSSQTSKRAKRKPKTYVPAFRTGAYGIIRALYDREQSNPNNARMSREEIVAEGQQYCNASYDMSEAGKSYTAWASMKTLLEKGYVWKQSSPSRYSLTDTGKAMAEQLVAATSCLQQPSTDTQPAPTQTNSSIPEICPPSERNSSQYAVANITSARQSEVPENSSGSMNIPETVSRMMGYGLLRENRQKDLLELVQAATDEDLTGITGLSSQTQKAASSSFAQIQSVASNTQETYVISSDEDEADLTEDIGIVLPTRRSKASSTFATNDMDKAMASDNETKMDTFWYSYIDTYNRLVSNLNEAAVYVDESSFTALYKIQYHTSQESNSFAINVKLEKEISGGFAIGYLKEHVADPLCPGLGPHAITSLPNHTNDKVNGDMSVRPPLAISQLYNDELSDDDLWTLQPEPEDCSQVSTIDQVSVQGDIVASSHVQYDTEQSQMPEISTYPILRSQPVSQFDQPTTLSQMAAMEPIRDYESVQCKSYPPGSFEVVLVLDSREVRSRRDRDYIKDAILKRGIHVEVRSLDLGDVMWVAQKSNGQGPVEELFLDIVLERKRMDDLVSSIKDGRFKEQKHRLKKSAAKQVFYLIEEFNMEEAFRFGQQAVQTALAATQVVDGFFVKHTTSIDESIDYLERLTMALKKEYESQEIYQIPASAVDKEDYMDLKKYFRTKFPDRNYLISSALYGQLNSKYGTLTLEDMFAKFLMTIRGVSAEKAYELKKTYRTPRLLMKAFDDCVDIAEERNLAKEATKSGLPRRRWGPSLSQKIWEIWRSRQYEP